MFLTNSSTLFISITYVYAISILDNQLADDDSLDDVKDTTFSCDVSIQPISSARGNNQNIVKENKKPVKYKSTKKIKTSQGNFFKWKSLTIFHCNEYHNTNGIL